MESKVQAHTLPQVSIVVVMYLLQPVMYNLSLICSFALDRATSCALRSDPTRCSCSRQVNLLERS